MALEEILTENEELQRTQTCEKDSPACVLEIPVSEGLLPSDILTSPTSCTISPKQNGEKGIPRSGSSSSSNSYGIPWKGIFASSGIKRNPSRRFSTSSVPMFLNYELAAKSIRQKFGRMWTTDAGMNCSMGFFRKASWRNFTYSELEAATDNFSPERLIGEGGHAEVFKGCLPDGTLIAVKRIIRKDDNEDEITADFLTELGIIAHVEHPNAAKLIGFGLEGGLYLILQYASNGSVDSRLQGSWEDWGWATRYKVAVGIAEGLSYLHHTCPRRIIHRDIKASNILLGDNREPLISDFGLAKWLPDKWLHHVVYPIEGTFGYLAPEYFMHGIADEKTDVFAYGVLLLELITGHPAIKVEAPRESLVLWAKPFLDSKNVEELVDPRLGGDYNQEEMSRLMATASMCLHHSPNERPYMNEVVEQLRGHGAPLPDHRSSLGPKSLLFDACNLDDYTCLNYLQDLDRHRQLVMQSPLPSPLPTLENAESSPLPNPLPTLENAESSPLPSPENAESSPLPSPENAESSPLDPEE